MKGDDDFSNYSTNETFAEVLDARMSRRGLLGGGLATIVVAGGVDSLLRAVPAAAEDRGPLLGFEGIEPSTDDRVHVPPGYTAKVLISWGDPVSTGPTFLPDAGNSAAHQAQQWGMHNDGVVYFKLRGSAEGLLVQNSEYTDDGLLFPDGTANWTAEKTAKSQNAHGVNIIHISKRHGGEWRVVRPSPYARRITAQTPITFGGPVAGDDRLKTLGDPTGRRVLGTVNNCAMGFTPWGTYLACEENFNGYFMRDSAGRTPSEVRYGIAPSSSGSGGVPTPGSTPTRPGLRRSPTIATSRTGSDGSSRSTPSSPARRR